MKIYPLILLIFIAVSGFVGCNRALIGISRVSSIYDYSYKSSSATDDSSDHVEGDKAGKNSTGSEQRIYNCKPGYSPRSEEEKTGNFLADECGDAGHS